MQLPVKSILAYAQIRDTMCISVPIFSRYKTFVIRIQAYSKKNDANANKLN